MSSLHRVGPVGAHRPALESEQAIFVEREIDEGQKDLRPGLLRSAPERAFQEQSAAPPAIPASAP